MLSKRIEVSLYDDKKQLLATNVEPAVKSTLELLENYALAG